MKTFLTTLLVLAALFTNAKAQALSAGGTSEPITFEGWPDGTVLTTQYPNVDFNGAVVLTAASAGGTLDDASYPPHSGTNLIYSPDGLLTLTFSSPVNFVNGYFTYTDGLVMKAYDPKSNLLTTAQGAYLYNWVDPDPNAPPNPPPNDPVGIALTTPTISTVVISSFGDAPGYEYIFADDISFTGSVNNLSPVPEPSSVILLGAAFLAGAYRCGLRGIRVRRHSRS